MLKASQNRHGAWVKRELQIIARSRGDKEIEPSKFEVAQTLYTGVDLENQILSDLVLIDMLLHGRYNKEAICVSLDNSTYFAKADELPPWRKVFEFDKFPDEVVEKVKVRRDGTAIVQALVTEDVEGCVIIFSPCG